MELEEKKLLLYGNRLVLNGDNSNTKGVFCRELTKAGRLICANILNILIRHLSSSEILDQSKWVHWKTQKGRYLSLLRKRPLPRKIFHVLPLDRKIKLKTQNESVDTSSAYLERTHWLLLF